ncbi:hypothetical protein DQQ10_14500 [Pseudochryseolinea flava]|uniref:DUF3592 domain-containing protein n=1 Tax=Pseudochryseolinea flava TaxID=2059302 RepID=A0A364Y2D0_9BACT|nr:hypothetical protein DQQ10_14500 [Pseudochryseolinea flava]
MPFVAGIVICGISLYIFVLFSFMSLTLSQESLDVDYEKIEKEGTSTQGVVTDISTIYSASINGRHPSDISYDYVVDGDTLYGQFRTIDPDVFDLYVGDEVDVRYLGSNSMLTDFETFSFPFQIIQYVCLIFLGIGVTLMLYAVIRVVVKSQLLKYGKIVEATFVKTDPMLSVAFSTKGVVFYQYTTSTGRVINAKCKTDDLFLFREVKPGDPIKIFVGTKNENNSSLIPAVEAQRNRWVI